jgi:hypothetical protein
MLTGIFAAFLDVLGPGAGRFGRRGTQSGRNVLPAVPTIHHMIDRAGIFHSHGARHGAMRFEITASGQAQNTIEKQPQTASLRHICWDQSTVLINIKGS